MVIPLTDPTVMPYIQLAAIIIFINMYVLAGHGWYMDAEKIE